MVNYKHGDYNIAIGKWEALLQNKPKNDTLYYFLGVAYMANKNDFNSIEHLNAVTKIKNSVFKSEAFYYLGLAYLKNGESEKAIIFFKQSDLEKSKQILDELN
ncbi:MAG: tetratricopeptide repeat protein, partial [Chlorobi bacterium]|nr:tetratricopeptide repeat protein [Chlorobiota bacterium]